VATRNSDNIVRLWLVFRSTTELDRCLRKAPLDLDVVDECLQFRRELQRCSVSRANAPMLLSHVFPQERTCLIVFADGGRPVNLSRTRLRSVFFSHPYDMLPPLR
jgi:hypothetical protein